MGSRFDSNIHTNYNTTEISDGTMIAFPLEFGIMDMNTKTMLLKTKVVVSEIQQYKQKAVEDHRNNKNIILNQFRNIEIDSFSVQHKNAFFAIKKFEECYAEFQKQMFRSFAPPSRQYKVHPHLTSIESTIGNTMFHLFSPDQARKFIMSIPTFQKLNVKNPEDYLAPLITTQLIDSFCLSGRDVISDEKYDLLRELVNYFIVEIVRIMNHSLPAQYNVNLKAIYEQMNFLYGSMDNVAFCAIAMMTLIQVANKHPDVPNIELIIPKSGALFQGLDIVDKRTRVKLVRGHVKLNGKQVPIRKLPELIDMD